MDDFKKRNSSDIANSAEIKSTKQLTQLLYNSAKNNALSKKERATLLIAAKESEKASNTLETKKKAKEAERKKVTARETATAREKTTVFSRPIYK